MTQSFVFLPAIQFKLYGFLIALGILFSYQYCLKRCQKYNLTPENVDLSYILGIILALVFARIYHILSSSSYYLQNPVEMFFFWKGGLGIFGAIIGGFLGILLTSKLRKIRLLTLLNLIFPSILFSQAIGRVGNFFNREGYGPITNLPWGINIEGSLRHPTFFYESLLCLVAFMIFVIFVPEKNKIKFGFSYYLICYGLIRFITEFFRIDTWVLFNLHIAFIFSIYMILMGLILLFSTKRKL